LTKNETGEEPLQIDRIIYAVKTQPDWEANKTLRRRSWKLWFWHCNGFNVKAFHWLKRVMVSYILRSRFVLLNLTNSIANDSNIVFKINVW